MEAKNRNWENLVQKGWKWEIIVNDTLSIEVNVYDPLKGII